MEDGNLTTHVLACPPQECLPFGCPGHELYVKGLAGCGVDTASAPVGATFNITFTVFDHHRPPGYASIQRTLTIAASPCPAGQFYCPAATDSICSPIPCFLLDGGDLDVSLEPPHIYLDLHNVPTGSVELLSPLSDSPEIVGGLVRPSAIRVWGVCGWALPVSLTAVCGARSTDTCAHNAAQCALRVQKENAAPLAAVVSFVSDSEGESGCALDLLQQELNFESSANATLPDRQCLGCSAPLAMQGQCEPSWYSMTMHGIDTLTGEHGAPMETEVAVMPAVARAQLRAQVAITAASDDNLQVFSQHCHLNEFFMTCMYRLTTINL